MLSASFPDGLKMILSTSKSSSKTVVKKPALGAVPLEKGINQCLNWMEGRGGGTGKFGLPPRSLHRPSLIFNDHC